MFHSPTPCLFLPLGFASTLLQSLHLFPTLNEDEFDDGGFLMMMMMIMMMMIKMVVVVMMVMMMRRRKRGDDSDNYGEDGVDGSGGWKRKRKMEEEHKLKEE